MRSPGTATKSSPHSLQLEKPRTQQQRPNTAKNKIKLKVKKKKYWCLLRQHIYTKIGMIQKRLVCPLRKDDTQICEAFHIFVVRWMDLESVIQSEISQKEKNKYRMLTHICGIKKKIVMKNLGAGQE